MLLALARTAQSPAAPAFVATGQEPLSEWPLVARTSVLASADCILSRVTLNLVLGVLACLLGLGLLVGNRYVGRGMFEGQQEQLEEPLIRAMWEHTRRQLPRWQTTDRYRRGFTVWLFVAAAMMLSFG